MLESPNHNIQYVQWFRECHGAHLHAYLYRGWLVVLYGCTSKALPRERLIFHHNHIGTACEAWCNRSVIHAEAPHVTVRLRGDMR